VSTCSNLSIRSAPLACSGALRRQEMVLCDVACVGLRRCMCCLRCICCICCISCLVTSPVTSPVTLHLFPGPTPSWTSVGISLPKRWLLKEDYWKMIIERGLLKDDYWKRIIDIWIQALGRIMAIVFPIRMQLRVGANKIDWRFQQGTKKARKKATRSVKSLMVGTRVKLLMLLVHHHSHIHK